MVSGAVRKWLELPPNATAHFMPLPPKWLGLDLVMPSMLSEACQLSSTLALRFSKDSRMVSLSYLIGRKALTTIDPHLPFLTKEKAATTLKAAQLGSRLQQLEGLKIQSILVTSLRSALTPSELSNWSNHIMLITPSIQNFARKALMRCLPTNANVHLWGKVPSDSCPNCSLSETENHVLNNCTFAATQGRYTWRHNSVLSILASHFQTHLHPGYELLVELPGYEGPDTLFSSILPDISIVHNSSVSVLELTCCYERNLAASKKFKLQKYQSASEHCKRVLPVSVHTVEVSSLGFLAVADLSLFCQETCMPPPSHPPS